MKRLAAALLAVLAAGATAAQDNPRVAAAERDMEAIYGPLVAGLEGQARLHLEQDQARWLANRRACEAVAALRNDCLELRARERAAKLTLFAQNPYPFVSEQAIVRSGKGKDGVFAIDASYPQFDGPSADFSAVNRFFAEAVEKTVADLATSASRATYDQDFSLYRPTPEIVSVVVRSEVWLDKVTIRLAGTLVDLRTGRRIPPEDLFATGDGWKARLSDLVVVDVVKEFMAMGRGPVPGELAEMVTGLAPANYLFEDERLVLSLDAVASLLGMKAYTVDIPYAVLRPLFRADGPLGGR